MLLLLLGLILWWRLLLSRIYRRLLTGISSAVMGRVWHNIIVSLIWMHIYLALWYWRWSLLMMHLLLLLLLLLLVLILLLLLLVVLLLLLLDMLLLVMW
uniref:Putativedisintegrin and metalloproteinase with thrombospondin motifs 16 n=1 Tax=Anopheles braziliensis TaxID=58242 RepID=A0A2M3Z9A4_9DIPT